MGDKIRVMYSEEEVDKESASWESRSANAMRERRFT